MNEQLAFIEWLCLHPGAREVWGAPGWFLKGDMPETTGGPHWHLHVRNRDGRQFDFKVGLWNRFPKYPLGMSFDGYVCIELHERYPDEFPDEPTFPAWPASQVDTLLNDAFDAFFNNDMEKFTDLITRAKRSLGRDVPEEDAA